MSFTYDWSSNATIAQVRLMVGDTDPTPPGPYFQDAEIMGALQVNSSQNIIIGLSGYTPAIPVAQQYSFARAAAMLLSGLGATRARNLFRQVTGVTIDGGAASKALCALGDSYITRENQQGYFAVAEMCVDQFSYRERLTAMLLRQQT